MELNIPTVYSFHAFAIRALKLMRRRKSKYLARIFSNKKKSFKACKHRKKNLRQKNKCKK